MCMTTHGTLTMASMLNDPLIQAVMHADGVREHELAALLARVKNRLADRAPRATMIRELEHA